VKKASQTEKILKYLKRGGTLTSLKALRMFGCLRLAARIYDIREMGHNVVAWLARTPGPDGSESRVWTYGFKVA